MVNDGDKGVLMAAEKDGLLRERMTMGEFCGIVWLRVHGGERGWVAWK